MGGTTSYNSGFALASFRWSSAGLRQPAVQSFRLLKGRSASVVPSLQVRKPAGRYVQCQPSPQRQERRVLRRSKNSLNYLKPNFLLDDLDN